jgi:hypothetical protein
MAVQVVLRQAIPVMYVESTTGLAGAAEAFRQLEARLSGLKQRRFYGTFQPPDGPYRACVAIASGDDPRAMGLAEWTIPGGEYGRGKLENWEDHIPEIGRTFERMARECERDPSRPSVEFYRSQKELVLLCPVKRTGAPQDS